jgi:hypothetical protein
MLDGADVVPVPAARDNQAERLAHGRLVPQLVRTAAVGAASTGTVSRFTRSRL